MLTTISSRSPSLTDEGERLTKLTTGRSLSCACTFSDDKMP